MKNAQLEQRNLKMQTCHHHQEDNIHKNVKVGVSKRDKDRKTETETDGERKTKRPRKIKENTKNAAVV